MKKEALAGAWPFWTGWRSSEFGELSSLCLSTNDRQCSPIQIVNNVWITAVPHRRTGAAHRSHRRVKRGRCGAQHNIVVGSVIFGFWPWRAARHIYYIHILYIIYILYVYIQLHTYFAGHPQCQKPARQQLCSTKPGAHAAVCTSCGWLRRPVLPF